jgi:transporter family-2 protein
VNRELAVVSTVVAGGLIALQAPINSVLGRVTGNIAASALSFAIGTAALVAIAAVAGLGRVGEARHLPWYYLTGGLLGALYVTCALVTVRSLGASGVTAATIAGQLAASVVLDQLGVLGVAKHPVTATRVAGVALLAAGTWLIVRE